MQSLLVNSKLLNKFHRRITFTVTSPRQMLSASPVHVLDFTLQMSFQVEIESFVGKTEFTEFTLVLNPKRGVHSEASDKKRHSAF